MAGAPLSGPESSMVLVAGATGVLGGAIARKLLAQGIAVRATSRSAERLRTLQALGAEAAVGDLRGPGAATRACEGIDQVVSTVNNVMGSGAKSPNKDWQTSSRRFGVSPMSVEEFVRARFGKS